MNKVFILSFLLLLINFDKDQKKMKWKLLLPQAAILWVFVTLSDWIIKKLDFPLLKNINEDYLLWFGGALFFLICCGVSIYSWRRFNIEKRKNNR
ncbi:hypothetical protein [Falsibacillus albus]|uniref:Uncharacterized protein n=1 Tax=Falsibacillus albus TaxID=2478915 RepID=A0A3L7JTV5_9BACI|nr:hypothetical protein [Falsibacillus albus]RLQ94283.1 hypothetical protein D9X91_14580 [Falsibacillus albus]